MAKSFYSAFAEQMDRLQSSIEGIYSEAEQVDGSGGDETESRSLPIDALSPGRFQPRRNFEDAELQELADSIRQQGLIQPVVVRPAPEDGRYEILAGERRWRACKQLGMESIEVVIREVDDQSAVAMSLIENIQRERLNPMEEAEGYQRLINEFGLTQAEVGELVGKSRSRISRLLSLLNLSESLRDMVRGENLTGAHGIVLAASGLDEVQSADFAAIAVKRKWSRDQLEKAIQRFKLPPGKREAAAQAEALPAAPVAPAADWSDRFRKALHGANVQAERQLAARYDEATGQGVLEVSLSADSVEAFETAALQIMKCLSSDSTSPHRPWRRRQVLRRRRF